jgi:hypothetical protein
MQLLTVGGKAYLWSLAEQTTEFKPLVRNGDSDMLDVLRIATPDGEFEVIVRINSGEYSDGIHHFLGPMLVVGGQFQNGQQRVQSGILVELRPKLCSLKSGEPDAATVERIVQWIGSSHFRAVRVNSTGGRWVGYGQ